MLHLPERIEDQARRRQLEREALLVQIRPLQVTLLEARDRRLRPTTDDKILADWNGLAIRALAEAGHVLDRPDWIDMARAAFDFVTESMMQKQRLAHAWCHGITTYPALASDYGAMINAALALFEATGEAPFVAQAERWVAVLEAHYSDGEGGYYYTADDAADVLMRTRHEHDDAAPSASAQILEALARLSLLSRDYGLPGKAATFAATTWGRVNAVPMAASGTINAIDTLHHPLKLILQNPTKEMRDPVRANHDPARLVLSAYSAGDATLLLPDGTPTDSGKQKKTAAYLCRGPVCLPPVFDGGALAALLKPGTA